jgi:antitoxin (DNA-binding transcriptional repressor) of toxin-antitoxin stability system
VADETIPTDISTAPELARIAHEVARTGNRHLLTENGTAIAVISPASAPRRRSTRFTMADPLWDIEGIAHEAGPSTIATQKDDYLAEAYATKRS